MKRSSKSGILTIIEITWRVRVELSSPDLYTAQSNLFLNVDRGPKSEII